jgi:predicted site-specific integrase-resolvase
LVVADPGGVNDDLVADVLEVLTSYCARLYLRALEAAEASR